MVTTDYYPLMFLHCPCCGKEVEQKLYYDYRLPRKEPVKRSHTHPRLDEEYQVFMHLEHVVIVPIINRRMLLSKSGFVGRAGKRLKDQ